MENALAMIENPPQFNNRPISIQNNSDRSKNSFNNDFD